ncbi:MAG: PLP-dependent aminotransferase family protein [Bifidobacteriaceae bacterium]|nr:PLP-dependent aminotransferase family protein [Bifidobacteriaceae bacterium]
MSPSLSWMPDPARLSTPIYRSLARALHDDIVSGTLLPGMKLPPQRRLASFLGVNLSTVTKAYKISEEEGITRAVTGRGTFVTASATDTITIGKGIGDENPSPADFGSVSAFANYGRLLAPIIRDVAQQSNVTSLLTDSAPTGQPLHKTVARHYLARYGITDFAEDQLTITSGGQNALTLLLLGLFKAGNRIAVDQFTYANFISLARMCHIHLIAIPSDSEGMRPDLLEAACARERIHGLYLMPDCNNPTGLQMSRERRIATAEIAKSHRILVIEDAYDSFLHTPDPALPSLFSLAPDSTAYIFSMTKPLSVGLRVAYLVVPPRFRNKITEALINVTMKTTALDAEIVTRAILSGTADAIILKKRELAHRTNSIFDRLFPSAAPALTADGHRRAQLFRWIAITSDISGTHLERRGLAQGLTFYHSDRFLAGAQSDAQFLRVSMTSINDIGDFESGLTRLKDFLWEYL